MNEMEGLPVPITDKDIESLALKMHSAVLMLDTVDGMNAFIDIVCKVTVAMAYDDQRDKQNKRKRKPRMDKHATAVLRTATFMLDKSINSGKLLDTDHVYLKRTAAIIKDWMDEGRITYRGLGYAKARMALDKIEREAKRQGVAA